MAQMWQPNPQILQQLVLTLQQSTSPGENHKEIYKVSFIVLQIFTNYKCLINTIQSYLEL